MKTLSLLRPDDWHVHLRDGAMLATTVPHMAARFGRIIVMPNLKPPVVTTDQALAYQQRILTHVPAGASFTPLMTLYLTDQTSAAEISRAQASGQVYAVKLYPAGATTHSDAGVTDIRRTYPALEAMENHGLPLLIHGEVVDQEVDVFDREQVFIERHLQPLLTRFPGLRIVFEHITTKAAADFVWQGPANLAATITAHHLLLNRNAMLVGGIRPHLYCLPILKREHDRQALLHAATSGSPKFFLGSDSAPHARGAKESACGCAGIYTGHAALELYAEAFDQAGALDKLEAFASHYGADFYGLPRAQKHITLVKQPWTVAAHYRFGEETLIPFRAQQTISWQLAPA